MFPLGVRCKVEGIGLRTSTAQVLAAIPEAIRQCAPGVSLSTSLSLISNPKPVMLAALKV
jgi:hypothetical protein